MGSDNAGLDQLKAAPWDRFAGWDRWPARILLLVVAALLVLAAIAPLSATLDGNPSEVPSLIGDGAPNGQTESERDEDLAFYDRVIERIGHGENYYDFIVEEQRARDYPVRPGLAVRLPTLAWIYASLGEPAMIALAVALLFACIWAWWKRLGEEPRGARFRLLGTALMAMGGSLGLNRSFFVLHELWAGMLIALAFGLHRPGRWGGGALCRCAGAGIARTGFALHIVDGGVAQGLARSNGLDHAGCCIRSDHGLASVVDSCAGGAFRSSRAGLACPARPFRMAREYRSEFKPAFAST